MIRLKRFLGIKYEDPIKVIAELKQERSTFGNLHYRIYDIRLLNYDTLLSYPLIDLAYKNNITLNGVYVPNNFNQIIKNQLNENSKLLIICNLELSKKEERIKHKNPFLLNVNSLTIQTYTKIDSAFIIKDKNDNIILKESVFNSIKNDYQEELKKIKKDYKLEEKQLSEQQEILKKNINLLIEEKNEKDKIINNLIDHQEILIANIEEKNIILENVQIKLKETKIELLEIEETMGKKLEKLRKFVKVHVDRLLELEFIDEEEYNDVLMINAQEDSIDEIFLTLKNDLNNNKQKAISHIQAYLFNKDIIYPRRIIEDFFALIQTNDLIILAGESGSGKTNLVKSFADAIGGKSFIIPVKPNWTSAEDLLGYYNPLEKKYLATPFLEALLEAQNNPTIPYFICLDEMNLARVEYYFADFLSLLEERNELPEIKLYSEDETSHILSELKNVLELIEATKEKYQKRNIINFIKLLQDEEINKELTRVFGFSDKDSLIKYHTDLRRMISNILNIPSSIKFPQNVRIIGAINIDETTHYLSPKILDRAHIMKFDSPLLFDWTQIADEIEDNENKNLKIKFTIEDLGIREPYPSFDKDDEFCQRIVHFTKEYFNPLGIEVGLRTIRQGLNYKKIFLAQNSDDEIFLNNFILHKILPKITFDSSQKDENGNTKLDYLEDFIAELEDIESTENIKLDCIENLNNLMNKAKENETITNYWA